MKTIAALSLLCVGLLAGCSTTTDTTDTTTAQLYPVAGPLSKQVPLPVLKAQADGIESTTGNITLTMPDGEELKGQWALIAPHQVTSSSGSGKASAQSGMAQAWTLVYGSKFSVSNLRGVNRGKAMLTGSKGTNLQIEFFTVSGTANGNGVARDSHGNVFKMVF